MKVKDFVPPVVVKLVRGRRKARLFDGDSAMFEREAVQARRYAEYGMGASTKWVLANTSATVVAVDTAEPWVEVVRAAFPGESRLDAKWIDLGPVADWGYPISYSRRAAFIDYREGVWNGGEQPDLILVDGRFRVACFLTSLLNAAAGTKIIFDDYIDRPHYHIVEEILAPSETCGRQALFIVPLDFNRPAAATLAAQFALVRD